RRPVRLWHRVPYSVGGILEIRYPFAVDDGGYIRGRTSNDGDGDESQCGFGRNVRRDYRRRRGDDTAGSAGGAHDQAFPSRGHRYGHYGHGFKPYPRGRQLGGGTWAGRR